MNNEIIFTDSDNMYYFQCPHCNIMCQVHKDDIRCTIFRHAVYKKNSSFVDPHATKEQCDIWIQKGEVYGCGKPFTFNGKKVEICGYI